ncbi:MAG: AbrB/MazE/SpoVT family DNA-binding domain-containing protein [Bifidobacterium tibiigranuli]|uniref:AbrB/MazE/SpoVT family DNA-binding domain-containing protein n=1 Tax=Bifidobacterium tibiigranuli TaxID=2172043 RepID=UPI00235589BA|nr:AbrB/MazE/SpoVT family DNA-binding domain-containing protein [Bifidobacterium tibiigranuli]MCH3975008.1 AbrB/MazE/SpoVT family DNA-binding domain-containing protein [Bifidobacterium tibiigranuli]MCH4189229.1 AbrB/MazE/SpoVT family DNA-binding domain-containing protein [Bifidobacterium tibiigranuli]MCH4202768.1 AbrB/MazE/SpoVT family DNA-binding domain-containing protein [Bifidobacterium tibiigranuli]MCH4273785.1 AbrB/MazE/SpoVT family DNA-binding domain-containing protein [Bifidobacterium ti
MTTMTVRKWGNSQGVRLSKTLLAQTGLHVGDELDVEIRNNSIVISPKRRRAIHPKNIDALFAGYEGNFKSTEDGFAGAVGREAL